MVFFVILKFHKDNGIVPKPAGTPVTFTPSAAALAIAAAEKERVAKRTAEEAFDKVFTLKKSIRNLKMIKLILIQKKKIT